MLLRTEQRQSVDATNGAITFFKELVVEFNVRTVHIRRSRNDQQYALVLPLLYSTNWLHMFWQ
jgi:hypothetical protein